MPVKNKNKSDRAIIPTANPALELVKSEGFHLYVKDENGNEKKIINWSTGIAVEVFGGCFPKVLEPVIEQLKLMPHSSLAYETDIHKKAARKLVDSFDKEGGVLFCLDGMGANERMIKAIYAYFEKLGKPRHKIITFEGAFHGRSVMQMAMTGKFADGLTGLQDVLEPLFIRLPFNDIEAFEKAANGEVAGIILEPVQGEGGVTPASVEFISAIKKKSEEHGILVAMDEVQTGMGRTGKLYGHQHFDLKPDLMSLAKALGGGVWPVGATLYSGKLRKILTNNEEHLYNEGTTFAGMPPGMAAVIASLELLQNSDFMKNSSENAAYMKSKLDGLKTKYPNIIEEIRGIGFMLGIKLNKKLSSEDVSNLLKTHGVSTQKAGGNVVRTYPPVNVPKEIIDEGISILDKGFGEIIAD